jgi:hypothetical protein
MEMEMACSGESGGKKKIKRETKTEKGFLHTTRWGTGNLFNHGIRQ